MKNYRQEEPMVRWNCVRRGYGYNRWCQVMIVARVGIRMVVKKCLPFTRYKLQKRGGILFCKVLVDVDKLKRIKKKSRNNSQEKRIYVYVIWFYIPCICCYHLKEFFLFCFSYNHLVYIHCFLNLTICLIYMGGGEVVHICAQS